MQTGHNCLPGLEFRFDPPGWTETEAERSFMDSDGAERRREKAFYVLKNYENSLFIYVFIFIETCS